MAEDPWSTPRVYRTDDCDESDMELRVFQGANGDWYVTILSAAHRFSPHVVRVTTSGQRRPGMVLAMLALYRAMADEPLPEDRDAELTLLRRSLVRAYESLTATEASRDHHAKATRVAREEVGEARTLAADALRARDEAVEERARTVTLARAQEAGLREQIVTLREALRAEENRTAAAVAAENERVTALGGRLLAVEREGHAAQQRRREGELALAHASVANHKGVADAALALARSEQAALARWRLAGERPAEACAAVPVGIWQSYLRAHGWTPREPGARQTAWEHADHGMASWVPGHVVLPAEVARVASFLERDRTTLLVELLTQAATPAAAPPALALEGTT